MASKGYPGDVLDQADNMLTACNQIDPNFRVGQVTLPSFTDEMAQVRTMQAQIATLEMQLTDLRNRRDVRLVGLWESIKRMRASIKGAYGDDSSEYELVGGTRRSERKYTPRKPRT